MNTTTPQNQQVTLYYKEGGSDKVYQVSLEEHEGGFAVTFAYGRRGATLQTGTKTTSPVEYKRALHIYEKLVKEKQAKGYTAGENGTPYLHTNKEAQVSGVHCQLLNAIEESDVERFIVDPQYWAQEKFDGRRLLIQKQGAAICGINRRGLEIGLPSTLVQSAQAIPGSFVIDGECVGERLHAFDLLSSQGEELRSFSYQERLVLLLNLLAAAQQRYVHLVETAFDTKDKQRLRTRLQSENREGIVFKRFDAPYTAGRPHSGGPQLKHKFYATLSALVAQVNQQRSVELSLLLGQNWKSAGNVTIPPNQEIPRAGDVVEVRYLYAFQQSGCLYQPTYLGKRSDVEPGECTIRQLKFKASERAEEEDCA